MKKRYYTILAVLAVMTGYGFAYAQSQTAAQKPAASAPPATVEKAEQDKPVYASLFRSKIDPNTYANPEKAAKLFKEREAMVEKIHLERTRILEEDPSAKALREEILLLNRRLASIIESKKDMILLNSQLVDIDYAIDHLAPAPQKNDSKK